MPPRGGGASHLRWLAFQIFYAVGNSHLVAATVKLYPHHLVVVIRCTRLIYKKKPSGCKSIASFDLTCFDKTNDIISSGA